MSTITKIALSDMECRRDDLLEWLQRHATHDIQDQNHLEEGSAEQTYWHYGYLVAVSGCARATR